MWHLRKQAEILIRLSNYIGQSAVLNGGNVRSFSPQEGLFHLCFLVSFLLHSSLFCYSCPNFPLLPSSVRPHSPLTYAIPTLLSTSMGHSYLAFDYSRPLLPTIPPSPFLSGHCQSVPCFNDSGSDSLISLFYSLNSSWK